MRHPSYAQLAPLVLEMLGKYQSVYSMSHVTSHDHMITQH